MKYVALLSGGKDSCFNLLHCARNGHQLVAAASLKPGDGKEELDSYMYQTVGQDAIRFIAQALGVPLYRRAISGDAVEQGAEYGARNSYDGIQGDETEDLYELLVDVKSRHPDIQGVSVGAILSNYQRVRVEHVCRRLSLTSLSYLWQRSQGDLLDEMIDAGMHCVLIKVAGIGLTKAHLGKSLAEMQPLLTRLSDLYGSHICGEGGEYETLTLDCPLFDSRVVLKETETIIHSDNDFATVAYLRVNHAILEPKHDTTFNMDNLIVPPLLDPPYITVQESTPSTNTHSVASVTSGVHFMPLGSTHKRVGNWVSVANVYAQSKETLSLSDEVQECFSILQDKLSIYGLKLADSISINVLLSTMEIFPKVNGVYSTFFGTGPPARATVAVDLEPGIRLKLDCIAYGPETNSQRKSLHVQGISYWAPANIGPYSQAITANEHYFISGQIGLIPSSMTLPSPASLGLETALAMQHASRIVKALSAHSDVPQSLLSIYWLLHSEDIASVKLAHEKCLEEDLQKDYPVLFVSIKSLPKDALVEKQMVLHTGQVPVFDDEGDRTLEYRVPIYTQGNHISPSQDIMHWEFLRHKEIGASCSLLCFKGPHTDRDATNILQEQPSLNELWEHILSIRLFYVPGRCITANSLLERLFPQKSIPVTPIPCRYISTCKSDDWDIVICCITA